MQYKNPVDIQLVSASKDAYDILTNICLYMDVSPNASALLRLKNAIDGARTEMQMQEEEDRRDFLTTIEPPKSMD